MPDGLVELYQTISTHADALNIPYLVIGATARDIILHHGFGANIERGTRDIDFAIQVEGWEQFTLLKSALSKSNFVSQHDISHRMVVTLSDGLKWEIDIIPFGNIANNNQMIEWPPNQEVVMSVAGFQEALNNALVATISESPTLKINVASPAGMFLLKLISWIERAPSIRGKDVVDIYYILNHYPKIPEITDSLYEEGYMEAQQYVEIKASTMRISIEASNMATHESIEFVNDNLFNNEQKLDNFLLDFVRHNNVDYEYAKELAEIIAAQFSKK
jgi:predicted nucleotidyltransferase